LRAGSLSAHGKITCKIFVFYTQLINVAAGCVINPDGPHAVHGLQVGDP